MEGLAFGLGMLVSILIVAAFLRWLLPPDVVIERRSNARLIFRIVHREDRAAYVRIMHRTLAVQMRDMNRQMTLFGRQLAKAFRPAVEQAALAIQKFGEAYRTAFRK